MRQQQQQKRSACLDRPPENLLTTASSYNAFREAYTPNQRRQTDREKDGSKPMQRHRFTKKTNTTPNSVRIHAQQTKLKTNPHLQNKCRKFFKTKALDFRIPRRPKPQQQKQGLMKAGRQARERETKKGGKTKHLMEYIKTMIRITKRRTTERSIHMCRRKGAYVRSTRCSSRWRSRSVRQSAHNNDEASAETPAKQQSKARQSTAQHSSSKRQSRNALINHG